MIDDAFDMVDAAIFGGIVGFVEESVRSEEAIDMDTFNERVEDYMEDTSDQTIRLLYNQNPGLVRHLLYRACQQRQNKAQKEDISEVYKEMLEEVDYLRKIENES